jgi:hypothetical protein
VKQLMTHPLTAGTDHDGARADDAPGEPHPDDAPELTYSHLPHLGSMKVPDEWLTDRAENAPIKAHRNLSEMASMRIRMAWQKLRSELAEGDELWAFENPSNTWKKMGRHNGYAIVRNGKIVKSVVVTSA